LISNKPARGVKRLGLVLIVLAIATLLALLFGSVSYAVLVGLEKSTVNPKTLLFWVLLRFYTWAALSPVVVLAARRHHFRGAHRGQFFGIHFCFSILFSLVHVAVYLPLFYVLDWPASVAYLQSRTNALTAGLTAVFPLGVLVYWVILSIALAVDFYQGYSRERMKASRLQAQLAEAQLEALKMQLQPHFLFNALHSLTDLVLEDPAQATRMIARLGDFLRLTLDNSGSQLVPLSTELEFLRCYLEIEHVRFQDRLSVTFDIAPHLDALLVPNLILQPLVENAIRHGVSSRVGPGKLDIVARQEAGFLRIQIMDDGPGLLPDESSTGRGMGLANIRERLQCLYGDEGALSLESALGGGAIATIDLPVAAESTRAALSSYRDGAAV
jgi:two-component system LytT family sensor kinase